MAIKDRIKPSQEATLRCKQPFLFPKNDWVFYNAYHFLLHLRKYDDVHCLSYTFNGNLLIPTIKITKVICAKYFESREKHYTENLKIKLVSNLHTKMYLCFIKGKLKDVYIGSWNFNSPSYLEVICKLPTSEHSNAREYFNQLWEDTTGV